MKKTKHRHSYKLEYREYYLEQFRLSWFCSCGEFKDFRDKINYKKACKVLLEFINRK